jgi:hypothetical protein
VCISTFSYPQLKNVRARVKPDEKNTLPDPKLSTSGEVTSFNRVPIGPRFAANRGALPTRLNDIMPNYFCRGAYYDLKR